MHTKKGQIFKLVLAVDVVVLTVWQGELYVLLPVRQEEPFSGARSLPGVAIGTDETLLQAAHRALGIKAGYDESGINRIYLEQLAVFDALYRDPRGRTISMAFLGLERSQSGERVGNRVWQRYRTLSDGSLPFDHEEIIRMGVERLQGKLRYTNIAGRLLPDHFRIEEVQAIYEAVLGQKINRTNFRMKLLKIGLIERTGTLDEAVGSQGGRPPHLYRFRQPNLAKVDRDFL
ncbi:hypothetical protein JXQ70_03655 [bacterium]|nr:hypothetical protein [bacterium]